MGNVPGKLLVHVSEAVLKRHATRRDAVFGPDGYRVEWRLLRVDDHLRSAAPQPVASPFSVTAAVTASPAAP